MNPAYFFRFSKCSKQFPTRQGFTLLETLIAITVLAIITSIAVPSVGSLVTRNQARVEANSFDHTLRLARTESRTRVTDTRAGRLVTLCASNSAGNACASNINALQNNGWLLFANQDTGAGYAPNGQDQLLAQHQPNNTQIIVTFNPVPPSGFITFTEFGANATNVTFSHRNNVKNHQITLTATGQIISSVIESS